MKRQMMLATFVAMVFGLTAQAATRTWTGGGDGITWSDAANWGGTAPGTSEPVIFPDTQGATVTITLPESSVTICAAFTVNAGGKYVFVRPSTVVAVGDATYTIGGQITVGSGASLMLQGVQVNSSTTTGWSLAGDLLLENTVMSISASSTIDGVTVSLKDSTLTVVSGKNITFKETNASVPTTLVLDNSTFRITSGTFPTSSGTATGGTIVFKGKAPRLLVGGAYQSGDSKFIKMKFNIPAGGYDYVPLAVKAGNAFPVNGFTTFEIEPDSGIFSSDFDGVVPLVASVSYIRNEWSGKSGCVKGATYLSPSDDFLSALAAVGGAFEYRYCTTVPAATDSVITDGVIPDGLTWTTARTADDHIDGVYIKGPGHTLTPLPEPMTPDGAVYATGANVFVDGDDAVFVWTDTSQAGSLTLANSVIADYLLVGGGGAGGFCRGGGGGGGGVLSGTAQRLGVGTYTISVGAGGTPDAWTKATRPNQASENCYQQAGSSATTCGGSSILTLNDATLLEAFGGGGGGNYLEGGGSGNSNGFTGGSGGGSTGKNNTYVAAGTLGQGSNGGANLIGNKGDAAAGGGGAGGAGESVTVEKVAGAGGVGVASSITGQEVYYGGGGGGGVYSGTAGAGGLGGGGHGGWGDGTNNGSNNDMTAGVDGLGGGGGGASGSQNKWEHCIGAKGGSGVVIIRMPLSAIFAPVVPEPVVPSVGSVSSVADGTTATITLADVVKGTDSTGATEATTFDVFAYEGDDPTSATERASDQPGETAEFQISGLTAGAHVYHVYIVNDKDVSSATNTVNINVVLPINERAAELEPGDWLAAPMTGRPSDIVNIGRPAKTGDNPIAYANTGSTVYSTDATVNGVSFSKSRESFTLTPNNGIFDRDGMTNCGLDTYYGNNILAHYWKGNISGQSGATTFSVTVPAAGTYLMQLVVHHTSTDKVYLTEDADVAIYGGKDKSAGDDWYYGGTFVHVFTMDAAGTYQFSLQYSGEVVFNMFQLRDITPPPSIAEQADELAATDGWLALPMQGKATDFATNGTCIAATAASQAFSGTGDASVAGIPFRESQAYFEGSGAIGLNTTGWDASTVSRGWFCFAGTDPTTDYAKIMGGARVGDSDITVTFNQLEAGRDYLVQVVVHNGRYDGIVNGEDGTGGNGNQDEYLRTASIDGETIQYGGKTLSDEWYYGGTLLKVFKADANGQYSFTMSYSAAPQVNAIQLRVLPKVLVPVAPSFTLGTPTVDGTAATITLTDVVKGTDTTGATDATTYDVFAYEGDDPTAATERASDQSGTTANFQVSDLAAGTHVYHVYIENDQGVSSVTNTVSVKIVRPINEQASDLAEAFLAGTSSEQWLALPLTGSPSDIVNIGRPAKTGDNPIAYANTDSSGYSTDATVNGVSFSKSRESFTFSPYYNGIFGQNNMTNCGLATYYGTNILAHYWKGNISGTSGATTFTVTVPAAGTYLMQLVVHHTSTDKVYLTEDADVAIYGGKDKSAGDDWYYGGTFVHVFTMDAAGTYQFTLQYSGEVVFNMFQLRDVTPVPDVPVYTLTIPAKTGLELVSVTTNGTAVAGTDNAYSIVSNTEVTVTFAVASGYELVDNDGVVTLTIEADKTFGDSDYPAVREQSGRIWTKGTYTPADWTATDNNLLASATPAFTGNWYDEGKNLPNTPSVLVDGEVPGATCDYSKICGIGNNAVLTWTFDGPTDLTSFSVYTRWGDGGRSGISIAELAVRHSTDGEWEVLTALDEGVLVNGLSYDVNDAALYGKMTDSNGGTIAAQVVQIRVTFGTQDNNGAGYVEFEAEGIGKPVIGSAEVSISGTTATVSLSDVGLSGAASYDVYCAYGSHGTTLPAPTKVVTGATATSTSFELTGLSLGGVYDYEVYVISSSDKQSDTFANAFHINDPASAVQVVGAKEIIDGDDIVYVWTDATQAGTLSLANDVTADYLLVGGGGAGGFCRGGGGGGGGVLAGTEQELSYGTYTITVGAGGTPDAFAESGACYQQGRTTEGASGKSSVVSSAIAVIFEAFGGGGGGNFDSGNNVTVNAGLGYEEGVRNVATGGGSAGKSTVLAAGYTEMGFAGGAANGGGGDWAAGGGGGAGEVGVTPAAKNQAGAGGAGVTSEITGASVCYGGGGGGGVYGDNNNKYNAPGEGGNGGGGHGGSNDNANLTAGIDGLGGGGGGASGFNNLWANCGGAQGGSGTVIIRIPLTALTEPIVPKAIAPTFATPTAEVDGASATITLSRVSIGTDETGETAATSYNVYAYTGAGPATDPVVTDEDDATVSFTLTDLAPGAHTYSVYIVNNEGLSSITNTVTFTIEDTRPLEERVVDMRAGDWLGMPLTGEAADVLTNGTVITVTNDKGNPYQFSYGRVGSGSEYLTDETVNNVPAIDNTIGFGVQGPGSNQGWTGFQGEGAGDCGKTGMYGRYMNYFFKCARSSVAVTNFCAVPAKGTYLVQMFVHYQSDSYLDKYVSVVGKPDVKIPYTAAEGTPGYYGGTLVHVFEMADAGTYSFELHYDKEVICNYIQVRDVTELVPQEPRDPSIDACSVRVEDDCARITVTGVDMGTDASGYIATSYDVYAAIDGGDSVPVATGLSEATAVFTLADFAVGDHTVDVKIVTNKGISSEEIPVALTIASAPTAFFPEGNWVGMSMTSDFAQIRACGDEVFALASSSGDRGYVFPYQGIDGVFFHDCSTSSSWDYYLYNYLTVSPEINFQADKFSAEGFNDSSGQQNKTVGTLLKRAWGYKRNEANGAVTITLKDLDPGARYVVQLTAHNNSTDGDTSWIHHDGTLTAPDGVTAITYGPSTEAADDPNRYGGTLIGTFVASNTTHAFTFAHTPADYFQFNTIQLRKLAAAPTVAPAYPVIGGTSVSFIHGGAIINLSGLDAGVTDGACDVYYAVAEEGDPFDGYTRAATGITGATCAIPVAVSAGKTYVYSVYAVNPTTKLASSKTGGSFTIGENPGIPDEMTVEPLIRPGLVQAKFGAGELFDSQVQPPLVSNLLAQTTYESSLDYTYGALMAGVTCDNENVKVLNTYTATQWNWDNTNTVFAYEGEIYLQKGQRLVIFGRFDDGEAAVVDGVTLLAQGNSSGYNNDPAIRWVVYTAAETGWYPLNAWVWDYNGGKTVKSQVSALAYNLEGITDFTGDHLQKWKHLEDTDGKGSFLRFTDPSKTLMTLGKPETNGVDVTINAAFTDVPEAAEFVAYVSMANDGGLDPLAWDDVIKIADIPAGDTAAANYTVKGLASYPFVRFAIESEASVSTAERCRNFRQMSRVVGFDSAGLAVLITDPVFAKTNGTFNVVVADMGAVTPLSLDVEVSTDPSFGTTVYQGTIDGIVNPGKFPVELTDLVPGTTYYIRVKPTGAGADAWIVSAPVETEKAGTVRINEIMASNGDTFKTKNGRSGLDWIEIYNGSDEVVDLSGWYLSDNLEKGQAKWKQIQGSCVIPVHGYGIVWCDKDYTGWDAANEAWSPIGLSTSGETVFLAKPDGTVVDTVTFGTQMKEISYGVGKLPGSDVETHVFFKVSTPGTENGEYGYGPMTPAVAFSVPHGYKTAPIDVAITCEADPDADIYYTLDGSQPTTSSTKYTAPIHIESTTILRAGVPQANTVLQVDSSATYIYLDDVLAMGRVETGAGVPAGFPESSAKHTMRYGMIQSIVNGPDRDRMLRGFTNTVATLSIVIDPDCLFNAEDGIYINSRKYMNDGASGERPMLLEQIDPVHGAANEFSVPGGLRLRGSSSLAESNPKHSLRFFFRGQYGMSKLEFPLFGEEGADSFSKVDLRCSQNYSWSLNNSDYDTFIHELFSRDSQRDLGQPYTRTRYYNLFINGQYWGLYMTQERGDKDFGETYLGGNEDYYDCIKTSSQDQWHYVTTANDGTLAAWRNLQGLAYNGFGGDYIDNYNKALGLNPDGTRNEAYPILLNPENLMAYVTIAHFVCDADGPVSVGNGGLNNLYANRYQIDGGSSMDGFWFLRHDAEHSLGVKGEGDEFGKWTQVTNDMTGIGTHEYNPLNPDWSNGYRGDPPEKNNGSVGAFGPYELHAQLEKNPVYKRAFADFFYKNYLKEGGAMTAPVAKQRFEARMAEIDDVIVSEAARWSQNENQPKSRETWLAACQSCLDFIDQRTAYMKKSYQDRGWYPTINAPLAFIGGVETDGTLSRSGQTVTFAAFTDEGAEDTDYEIVYTTDGSDPADSATAVTSKTLTLGDLPVTVLVRATKGGDVSALTEITFRPDDGYTFYFTGAYTGDQTINPTGKECVVIFEDAAIAGKLVLPDGVKAYLCPTNGTENTVAGIVGEGAHLTLKDFDGLNGKVSLSGEDTLIAISNLVVKSGTLDLTSTGVTATKTPVVNVLGHVKQDGGVINLYTSAVDDDLQVYGIYVANKDPKDSSGEKMKIIYAEFNGGTFNATVGGWKSAALYIDKGSVEATFNEGSTNNVELVGPEARFVNASGDLNLKGAEFSVAMPETYTSLTNARVFKSDKKIKIKGGHYVVNVPASGSEIFSTSDNGKGDESSITIDGGTFELSSDDDCFNADHHITVNDGLFYAVSLNNDVFDSNGDMTINGGTIMAYATAAGHEAFDVDPVLTEDFGIPHVLTINGGTIFATGGSDSAWPKTLNTGTGVTLLKLEDTDVSAYSDKYLTLTGSVVTTTAKLPAFDGNGSLLATCLGLGTATTSDTEPEEGDQDFHDLYIVLNEGMDQKGLRFYEIYGSTTGDGDTGEYIILTNVSNKAINLAGVKVNLEKLADYNASGIDASKCCFTLTGGTLAAGEAIRLDQATYWSGSKKKITNGDLHIEIFDATGATVQVGETSFSLYAPETDGGGASLIAKRFDNETPMAATKDDWASSYPSVGSVDAVVTDLSVTITLSDISLGKDASSYDVYLSIDGAAAQKVGEGVTETTFEYTMNDLEPGNHTYSVYIKNDQDVETQATEEKSFTVNAPEPDIFPEGIWEAKALTRFAAEIVTNGTEVYALATSAGNKGRTYTVNGIKYHDSSRNNSEWGEYYLPNHVEFVPALTGEKDSFGGEDAPTVSGEDMGFNTVCKRAWFSENTSRTTTDFTMTLKDLEPGAKYIVQLTAHNGSDQYGGPSQTMTAPDGVATITLGDANTNDVDTTWRYGGTLIGTFVASNTTHAFTFTYGSDPRYYQLNSIQLRKLEEAPEDPIPEYPTVESVTPVVNRGEAKLVLSDIDSGIEGGAYAVYYAVAKEGDSLGEYQLATKNQTATSYTIPLTDLVDGTNYIYSVYVANAAHLASSKADGSFALEANPGIPDEMTVGPVIRPGLVQAKFGVDKLFTSEAQPPLVSNLLTQTTYESSLDLTYGAFMAEFSCDDEAVVCFNPYTAKSWNWDKTHSAFAYEGEIYLEKGQQLVIYGRFDDGSAAVVDGVTLLAQGDSSGYRSDPAIRWVVYEPAETGWYPLNAWVWDYSGGKNVVTAPSALAYNLSGIKSMNDQNRDQWKHLEDTDGKGSFLRSAEAKTLMTLGLPVTNGLDVTINAAFTDVPSAAKFVAYVSTSHDGGDDPRGWDGFIEIADVAAGTTAAQNYTLEGLASYPFVRFAIQKDGSKGLDAECTTFRQMSNVVGFDAEGLAVFVGSPVIETKAIGFDVVVASMGEAETLDLLVEVSKNSDFSDPVYSATVATGMTDEGSVPVKVSGLDHMTTYYVRVKPTADNVEQDWIVANPIKTLMKDPVVIDEIQPTGDPEIDTEAIQRAIDLAADAWPIGTVPLGAGEFHVSAELMVTGGVTLVGRGWDETVIVQESSVRVATVDNGAVVSSLTLTGGTTASGVDGAGAYVKDGTLSYCCVSNNAAGGDFGGVAIEMGSIDHTRIVDNEAKGNGGGLGGDALKGEVTVETCLIADNAATGNGGGVSVAAAGADESANFVIKNTTIAGNEANDVGGGVSSDFGSLTLVNDIVADNTATSNHDLALDAAVVDSVAANSSNDLFGSGTAIGTGSVVGSPVFNPAAGDYHLLAGSAAIGLGAWYEGIPTDLDGRDRESWKMDAGCFERSSLHVGTPTAVAASDSALIELELESIGEDATAAEVTLAWGTDPEDLSSSAVIATAATEGETVDYLLEGLEKNTTYYYALTVKNNATPSETVTTVTNTFTTAEISEVLGMYESYPTDPEAVPEGYVVTFIASDTVNPYYVVPALGFTYPVETTITNDVTGAAEVYHYRNEADFLANASARIDDDYYLFLSDAVDASVSGDTIEVIRDNNFVGKTMIIDHKLTIEGSNHTVKVAHPFVAESGYVDLACTTNVKTIFRVKTGGDVVLRDMTVMGGGEYLPPKEDGTEDPGSNNAMIEAIIVSDGFNTGDRGHGFLEMENVTVTRSQGALLVGTEAHVRINRCQLVRNCRNCAGGIYNHGTVVMENSSLSENRSLAPGGGGGGAAENQGEMYINNCVICNNSSTEVGGAINNYSADHGVKLYLMNSTISGNFTTWRNGEIKPGGGVGLRAAGPQNAPQGLFYAVNDLVCNNYYYDPATGEVEVNDITLYGNGTTNEIAYCVFGNYNTFEYVHESTLIGNETVDVTDLEEPIFLDEFASYRVYANAHDTTNEINGARLYSDPAQPLARYAPINPEGPAATMGDAGVTTYFDASGWKTDDIRMSYKTKDGSMTALGDLVAADEDALVTTFYESAIVPTTVDRDIGMVGASGWSDADTKFYTLKLIAPPLNGTVGNITLFGDTYRNGTEVTITATPDPKSSFIGWFDENDEPVSDHASYTLVMTKDTFLRAKFTEPMWTYRFVNIECEQTAGTHGKFPLEVLTNWLAQAFSDICPNGRVTEDNLGQIEARLNAPDTVNGLNHVWMNYVLGGLLPGDPDGRIWIRADQTRDPETLRFRIQEFAPVKDCGFSVRYRLNAKAATSEDYVRNGAYETSGSFDDKFKVWQTAHRVIDMIFIPDGYALSEEYVTTVNTAGVLKVESSKKIEILASPWAGFSPTNNPAVKADEYVKASALTVSDVLYVYDQANSNYLAWAVQADGTWKPLRTFQIENGRVVAESGEDATRTNAIPRGAGAWLERQDVTKPIYLYGQVDGSAVATAITPGWNLIGSPSVTGFDVTGLPEPKSDGESGDHVIIPTDAAPINLTYKNGSWGYTKNVVRTIGGKTLIQPTRVTEVPEIPAGCGFWYISTGGGEIEWQAAGDKTP